MDLRSFLQGLSEAERDFISNLDYGEEVARHRVQLDHLIDRGGHADLGMQLWHPYEVIELGKNWLQEGHEREFVACAGIVMLNIISGEDRMNDWQTNLPVLRDKWSHLALEHQKLLEPLIEQTKQKG